MVEVLLFIAASVAFAGLMAFGYFAVLDEFGPTPAVVYYGIVTPLGVAALWLMATDFWQPHEDIVLDGRYWACATSHTKTSTTYTLVGKMMVPITTTSTVCDAYTRR